MNLLRTTLIFILILLTAVFEVKADVLTENFSTLTQKNSATAVWNIGLGIVHPGLQVSNYKVVGFPAVPLANFSVGDGSDGPFSPATYANFGTVSGSTITVNANTHPALNVTSFQLANGSTLTAINGPLIIYSQTTVQIDGTINCDGAPGIPGTVSGGAGGPGFCGGGTGGNGGNSATSGLSANPVAGSVTGGHGGVYSGIGGGAGGGGGGAFAGNDGSSGLNSSPATNTGGAGGSGSAGANHDFTVLDGSPGGGGGSGSNTEGGGGGGGGGGTVVIHAVGNVTISATGLILARGGPGGASLSGGGGGGGGGGSVKIFTAGNLELNTGTDVDVTGGVGGTPVSGTAGAGGTGSYGRTWLNYSTFSGTGSESNPSLLQQVGVIEYNTVSQTVVSNSYDVSSTTVLYNSVSTDTTSADIGIEVAGSTDNFSTNDTGWLPLSNLSTLNSHRYFKFRVTLINSNATVPTTFSSLNVDYNPNPAPSPSPSPSPGPSPSPSPSPAPAPLPVGAPAASISASDNTYQFSGGCGLVKAVSGSNDDDDFNGPFSKSLQRSLMLVFLFLPFVVALALRPEKGGSES
jgi:hypothetical protein